MWLAGQLRRDRRVVERHGGQLVAAVEGAGHDMPARRVSLCTLTPYRSDLRPPLQCQHSVRVDGYSFLGEDSDTGVSSIVLTSLESLSFARLTLIALPVYLSVTNR